MFPKTGQRFRSLMVLLMCLPTPASDNLKLLSVMFSQCLTMNHYLHLLNLLFSHCMCMDPDFNLVILMCSGASCAFSYSIWAPTSHGQERTKQEFPTHWSKPSRTHTRNQFDVRGNNKNWYLKHARCKTVSLGKDCKTDNVSPKATLDSLESP